LNPNLVAIVEDNVELARELKDKLAEANIIGRIFSSRVPFANSLEHGDPYDLVILDWFFEDSASPVVAKLVLEDLRKYRFAPVAFYTEQPEVLEGELGSLQPPFNRAPFFGKDKTDPHALIAEVTEQYEQSMSARLSSVWRSARQAGFEESLYELDALEGEDLQRTMQNILVTDAGEIADIDTALDFLERYVGRKVLADRNFKGAMLSELEAARRSNIAVKGDQEQALTHAHRYIMSTDSVARSGDIVELLDEDGEPVLTGVVLTPSCDLVQSKSWELRIVLADESKESPRQECEWYLNAFKREQGSPYKRMTLNFHRTLFLSDISIGATKAKRAGKLIRYDHEFVDVFGRKVGLRPICRLDDPYRSDLFQKFSSHASRLGIP
jgi:hypothetical protein